MDYYGMMTILGILFWVLAAIVCIGFLGWVYTQIVYMLLARADWKRDNQIDKPVEPENDFNECDIEEETDIDNEDEI